MDAEIILQHIYGHVRNTDLILELELFRLPQPSRHGLFQGNRKLFNTPPVACSCVVSHGCFRPMIC
jgi:hypothetical protein